jgi:hypothetical protein
MLPRGRLETASQSLQITLAPGPRNQLTLHQVGWDSPLKFTVYAEVGPNLAVVKKWQVAA